ncbi:MAG: response regulator [Candidatus Hermodarchaeota archaeon]
MVDDDRTIVYLFEKLLHLRGHEVVGKAYDGEQAVEMYKNDKVIPDIILMDHRMPRKDGLTVSKEILGHNCDCKIIFVSADESAKEKALELGVAYFLVKPISIMDLLIVIEQVLSGSPKKEPTMIKPQPILPQ